MIARLFTYTTAEHFPQPAEISPITGRPIAYRYAWQMQRGVDERAALSRLGKAWRTRRGS